MSDYAELCRDHKCGQCHRCINERLRTERDRAVELLRRWKKARLHSHSDMCRCQNCEDLDAFLNPPPAQGSAAPFDEVYPCATCGSTTVDHDMEKHGRTRVAGPKVCGAYAEHGFNDGNGCPQPEGHEGNHGPVAGR